MKILENHSLKNVNTFGVDVIARYFAEFESNKQLKELLQLFNEKKCEILILGSGSNILFTKDYPGAVLKNNIFGINIITETDTFTQLKVGAGVIWDNVVKYAVANNLWGIENLSLIPGTAGAAPIQNIGAYGTELKDVLDSVEIFNFNDFTTKNISNKDCEFGYRDSIFKNKFKNKFVITDIILNLVKIKKPNLSYQLLNKKFANIPIEKVKLNNIRKFIIETRKSKLPDVSKLGNAGSFFKNPILSKTDFVRFHKQFPNITYFGTNTNNVKISAAKLIEAVGMKGIIYGNTGTFKNHSLIIINNGNASGSNIYEFSKIIKRKVLSKFNIKLNEEVNIV